MPKKNPTQARSPRTPKPKPKSAPKHRAEVLPWLARTLGVEFRYSPTFFEIGESASLPSPCTSADVLLWSACCKAEHLRMLPKWEYRVLLWKGGEPSKRMPSSKEFASINAGKTFARKRTRTAVFLRTVTNTPVVPGEPYRLPLAAAAFLGWAAGYVRESDARDPELRALRKTLKEVPPIVVTVPQPRDPVSDLINQVAALSDEQRRRFFDHVDPLRPLEIL